MELESQVKLAIYRLFANSGERPSPEMVAKAVGSDIDSVLSAYKTLRENRMLVLEPDGASIRMAPPFSGIPTQHVVISEGRRYFANCAWDALGVVAALQRPGTIYSRCEQSLEPFTLNIGNNGPEPSDWLFHCLVPASHWWDDIVFT